jgi:hypothetical protein
MKSRMRSLVCSILLLSAGSFAQEMMEHSGSKDMMKDKGHGGTVTAIISHEVKDYAPWRKVFDADEPNRKGAGMKVWGVYADVKNPNMVTIIATFPSVAAMEAFVSSPKLKEAMDKGGVLGKPDVKVLNAMAK